MNNVIRPRFGAAPATERPAPVTSDATYLPLRVIGTAAAWIVALRADASAPGGPVLTIVTGPAGGNSIASVAIFPATPAGDADAERAALAILRTLELVEAQRDPSVA